MLDQIKSHQLIAFTAMFALLCFNASADFDKATKAYLLGDYEKARYESLVAATDGNPKAQMLMGQLYFNGEGVKKDVAHALYWYEKAAESEFSDAQYRLGMLYHEGKKGVVKDLDKSYKWLMKAFDNGHKKAKDTLEWLHKNEQGKVVSLKDNLEVLKQVAGSGNKQARFLLSQKMIKGSGIPQDKAGAVKMLTEDAKQGFIRAQKQLGELYFFGDGVEKNYIEAYGWSMAYAGTKELGGIAREGKQTARSSLRKLPGESHNEAYLKSKEYYEKFVLPFHGNAREVGPEKYRIVVRSRTKKDAKINNTASSKPAKAAAKKPDSSNSTALKQSKTPTVLPALAVPGKVPGANNEIVESTSKAEEKKSADKVKDIGEVENNESTPPAKGELSAPMASVPAALESTTSGKAEDESPDPNLDKDMGIPKKASPAMVEPVIAPTPGVAVPDASMINESVTPEPAKLAERNFDDVYNVLVRKKSDLYKLYTREYELDKKLQGRTVFEIVIASDGSISSVKVLSNTVESSTLEQTLIDHLKNNVKFPSMDVADFKISYPVDFLPR